jgi:hypothetical protein
LPIDGRFHLPGASLVLHRRTLAEFWVGRSLLTDRRGSTLSSGGDTEMLLTVVNAGLDAWYSPTLAVEHFIPRSRIAFPYLCKLAFGIASSDAQLWHIQKGTTASWQRLTRFAFAATDLCRICSSWLIKDVLLSRSVRTYRRIQVSERFGAMLSAWRLFAYGPSK